MLFRAKSRWNCPLRKIEAVFVVIILEERYVALFYWENFIADIQANYVLNLNFQIKKDQNGN